MTPDEELVALRAIAQIAKRAVTVSHYWWENDVKEELVAAVDHWFAVTHPDRRCSQPTMHNFPPGWRNPRPCIWCGRTAGEISVGAT